MRNRCTPPFRRVTVTVRAFPGTLLMWTTPRAMRMGRGVIIATILCLGIVGAISWGRPEDRYFLLEVVALGVALLAARYALTCRRCRKSPVWWAVTRGKLLHLGWAFDRPDCPYCGLNVTYTDRSS